MQDNLVQVIFNIILQKLEKHTFCILNGLLLQWSVANQGYLLGIIVHLLVNIKLLLFDGLYFWLIVKLFAF